MSLLHPDECLCGIHVHRATKTLAVIDIIFAGLGILGCIAFIAGQPNESIYSTNLVSQIIRIVVSGMLL